ncbi:MAG: hypothetical protein GYB26_09975 [Gammaproteobacteria bacterium]|nr:hypothetical protein [Gammaproteobacteria bacterium]
MSELTPAAQSTRNRQILTGVALFMGLLVVGYFVVYPPTSGGKAKTTIDYTSLKLEDLAKLGKGNQNQEWLARSEGQLAELKAQMTKLENETKALKDQNQKLGAAYDQSMMQNQQLRKDAFQTIDAQAEEVERLSRLLEEGAGGGYGRALPTPVAGNGGNPNTANSRGGAKGIPAAEAMESVDFELESEEEFEAFDLSRYLPAGSYAPAEVIAGADASTSVKSQSDPRQMLFRIKGPAVASIYEGEEQLVPTVEGCTVTAAVRGDLSSEKGYAKLLAMTCSIGKGKVIETEIKGYAAETGKAGIRGPVVSREGDLVEKAFWSGVVGGIGDGVESKFQSTSQSAFGAVATTDTDSTRDILEQGVGEGIGESGRMLSRYFIERAEQYQPVIPLAAGTNVELVFLEGTFLDGKDRKKKSATSDNQKRG